MNLGKVHDWRDRVFNIFVILLVIGMVFVVFSTVMAHPRGGKYDPNRITSLLTEQLDLTDE